MVTVLSLARFILARKPEENPVRLAFYHYLKNWRSESERVGPEVINDFVCRALSFDYWQENSHELEKEIFQLLRDYGRQSCLIVEDERLLRPSRIQIVDIKHDADFASIFDKYIQSQTTKESKVRILPYRIDYLAGFVLQPNKELKVYVCSKRMRIENGRLVPLQLESQLNYDCKLNLMEDQTQIIRLTPYVVARLRVNGLRFRGCVLRGYTFQIREEIDLTKLTQNQELFYALRSIESLFIDRQTDEIYQEITARLERSIRLLEMRHPEAFETARQARDRAQLALENIYFDDRILSLLIRDLDNRLKSAQSDVNSFKPDEYDLNPQCPTIRPINMSD